MSEGGRSDEPAGRDQETKEVLEQSSASALDAYLLTTSAGAHPAAIGPWRILEVLGEGGMGLVYLAEQTEPVRRRVALKLIKLGMDTREVLARFDRERQALALMDHPNIARVLDAGAAEDGRPYFVMTIDPGLSVRVYPRSQDVGIEKGAGSRAVPVPSLGDSRRRDLALDTRWYPRGLRAGRQSRRLFRRPGTCLRRRT